MKQIAIRFTLVVLTFSWFLMLSPVIWILTGKDLVKVDDWLESKIQKYGG